MVRASRPAVRKGHRVGFAHLAPLAQVRLRLVISMHGKGPRDRATKRRSHAWGGRGAAPKPRGLPGRRVCGCQRRGARGSGARHTHNVPPDRLDAVRKRSAPIRCSREARDRRGPRAQEKEAKNRWLSVRHEGSGNQRMEDPPEEFSVHLGSHPSDATGQLDVSKPWGQITRKAWSQPCGP